MLTYSLHFTKIDELTINGIFYLGLRRKSLVIRLSFVKLCNLLFYRLWRPSPLLGGDLGVGRFVNAVEHRKRYQDNAETN